MERIGLAASKMAQGNVAKYNLFVVAISSFVALLLFLVCGFAIVTGLFLINLLLRKLLPSKHPESLFATAQLALSALAVMVGALNIVAILKNIKFGKSQP